jgi:exopolysaccharide production protein ExoY
MNMAEGRNHNSALPALEVVASRNGSRAQNNGVHQTPAFAERASFPELPRWKRVFDLTCVLLTLPFWLPLTIVVMVWIAITSRGPVFFRQKRVGYRRHPFMLFKFRTMHVNADTQTHAEYFFRLMEEDCPMTKLDAAGDPRLIAGGRFLRASGLDELPQIFNVLRGEMSLVGPRPCLPHEFERYGAWQQERVNALPGLTGYWQVNGKNKTTFSEMIAMDIFYARNMSVWLDLKIILKTIPALIGQTLESRGVPEIVMRQRTVRPEALPERTSSVVNRI